jgi:type I restriction enzyme S subunit
VKVRLEHVAPSVRESVSPQSLGATHVFHYSLPVIDETGDGREEEAEHVGEGKTRLYGGEVLISKLNPRKQRILLAEEHEIPTICSSEFVVLNPRKVERRFLIYFLRSERTRQDLDSKVQSVTRSQQRVRPDDITKMWLDLPDNRTQTRIANYLDAETARIDALIAKKRGLIELAEERWLGSLRKAFSHSPGIRLKYLLRAPLAYGVLVPERDPDGVPMLRITDLAPEGVVVSSVARIPPSQSAQYRRTVVASGDLVVSVVGTLGRSIEISPNLSGCNLNRALARVRLASSVPKTLIRYWFESPQFRDLAALATSSDSAQPTLGLGDLKNFTIGLPDAGQWKANAMRLEIARTRIDATVMLLRKQLLLLTEHRRALITAAVTGELQIPGAAA